MTRYTHCVTATCPLYTESVSTALLVVSRAASLLTQASPVPAHIEARPIVTHTRVCSRVTRAVATAHRQTVVCLAVTAAGAYTDAWER